MGIPVVATDLLEIRRFNAEHGDIVVDRARRRGVRRRDHAGRWPIAGRTRVAPDRGGAREQLAGAHRADVGAHRQAAVAARASARSGGTRACSRAYRRARRRTARAGRRPPSLTYLLVFQTPLVWMLAEPAGGRRSRRVPADASSCSPAAWANRGRRAAGTRNA